MKVKFYTIEFHLKGLKYLVRKKNMPLISLIYLDLVVHDLPQTCLYVPSTGN